MRAPGADRRLVAAGMLAPAVDAARIDDVRAVELRFMQKFEKQTLPEKIVTVISRMPEKIVSPDSG